MVLLHLLPFPPWIPLRRPHPPAPPPRPRPFPEVAPPCWAPSRPSAKGIWRRPRPETTAGPSSDRRCPPNAPWHVKTNPLQNNHLFSFTSLPGIFLFFVFWHWERSRNELPPAECWKCEGWPCVVKITPSCFLPDCSWSRHLLLWRLPYYPACNSATRTSSSLWPRHIIKRKHF